MIRLDYRTGSGELEPLFKQYGIKVEKTTLANGDFDWIGRGPNGVSVSVVAERKRLDSDLIDSMFYKRLSGKQLPGMSDDYDYGYLIIEGIWQVGLDGQIEVPAGRDRNGKMLWRSLGVHSRVVHNYVMGLSFRAGLQPWKTKNDKETVSFIVDQYRMWTEKSWDEHKCHEAVYAPAYSNNGRRLQLTTRKIPVIEKILMQLPGLDSRAKQVAAHLTSEAGAGWLDYMNDMTVKQWADVKGVGKVGAKRIWEALHE